MVILSMILVALLFRVVLLTYPELRFGGERIDRSTSKANTNNTVRNSKG